jgi:5-methylcytosine-specific restriction endonuclease McrA
MNNILHKDVVLVLNRNWQAIGVKTPADTFSMLMTDAATAINIAQDGSMMPIKWQDWIKLSVHESDFSVNTVNKVIKVPKVIVLCRFDRVPKKRPRFSAKNIWVRDNFKCAYTGKNLKPSEGNIDHLVPKSRGGRTSWTNCVLACKEINAKKADKTPEEAGLKLLIDPKPPKELPIYHYIKNKHNIKEWDYFLHHGSGNKN